MTPPASILFRVDSAPVNVLGMGFFAVALGVLLGAFGAHGLSDVGAQRLGWWATASLYHFIAGFGLVAHGLLRAWRPVGSWTAFVLLGGMLLFSGSLYAMVLGAPRWLGAVTPVGGVLLVLGFAGLGAQALVKTPSGAAGPTAATSPR